MIFYKLVQNRITFLIILLLVVSLSASLIFPNTFFTFDNLRQIMLNLSIDTIVAVGMMVLLIAGVFDLSVGSVVAFTGCLTSYLLYYFHLPIAVAVLCGLTSALLIGWANGYLVAYAGINPMIQTLAALGIVRGAALMISAPGTEGLPYWFNAIGQSKLVYVQAPVWYMVFIVSAFSILVNNTVFFRRYYYIGGNEAAAELSGIRVKKMKVYAFIISAGLAGFAGILLSSRLGAALPTMGRGMELRVITAVILGGASLQGGSGKISGALVGTLFMGIISNIMVIARISGYWNEIILGLILIGTLWIDKIFQTSSVKR